MVQLASPRTASIDGELALARRPSVAGAAELHLAPGVKHRLTTVVLRIEGIAPGVHHAETGRCGRSTRPGGERSHCDAQGHRSGRQEQILHQPLHVFPYSEMNDYLAAGTYQAISRTLKV